MYSYNICINKKSIGMFVAKDLKTYSAVGKSINLSPLVIIGQPTVLIETPCIRHYISTISIHIYNFSRFYANYIQMRLIHHRTTQICIKRSKLNAKWKQASTFLVHSMKDCHISQGSAKCIFLTIFVLATIIFILHC